MPLMTFDSILMVRALSNGSTSDHLFVFLGDKDNFFYAGVAPALIVPEGNAFPHSPLSGAVWNPLR